MDTDYCLPGCGNPATFIVADKKGPAKGACGKHLAIVVRQSTDRGLPVAVMTKAIVEAHARG